jgi:hypothetical protein
MTIGKTVRSTGISSTKTQSLTAAKAQCSNFGDAMNGRRMQSDAIGELALGVAQTLVSE